MRRRTLALLLVVAGTLPSCLYAGGHHWRLFTRQPKETIDLPDTLGVPRLKQQLAARRAEKISNLEVWTAVEWNESLRLKKKEKGPTALHESTKLYPGARISVRVADEPTLSKEDYWIRSDGTFSFPYVKDELYVEGKTSQEVAEELRQALLVYYKDPKVTVNVEQGPQRIGVGNTATPDFGNIMVFGELGGSGGSVTTGGLSGLVMPFSGREKLLNVIGHTGMSSRANWRNVAVFRREPDPEQDGAFKTLVIVSDMSNFFKKADYEQDFPLKENDIVFVPTQPEYVGVAFKHDWDLVLSYLGGISSYDDFVRRLDNNWRIIPRPSPNTKGPGE